MASPRLIERLRAEDVLRPHAVVEEARRAGLSLPLACALLEKESGRGRNVFGHDPTIFVGAGEVTRAKHLDWARQNGWKGTLNSGFRDPAYSEKLCISMCGAPSCPGRCAGRASNHAGSSNPAGAVDVSDYVTFGQLMRRCPYSPKIFNALGAQDPVHFSASGR